MTINLPFSAGRDALLAALSRQSAAVIQAPPGTGKTTLAPGYVQDFLRDRATSSDSLRIHSDATPAPTKVIVTQPRRIAARASAARVASIHGWSLGQDVGYTIRGESRVSPATQIEFVTSGVLLRRLLRDPDLADVGAVIIDEIHERHLESDLVFGMLAQLRELREDLVVVAMSATVDAARFATLLDAPIVDVPNPIHPLEIHYSTSENSISHRDSRARPGARGSVEDIVHTRILEALKHTAVEHTDASPGDLLAFVPTIRGTEILADKMDGITVAGHPIEALALHGGLSPKQQSAVVSPRNSLSSDNSTERTPTRRVIIATDVAESSLTVPGARTVVDSCLSRVSRLDSSRGMSQLVTESASQASTVQRAGRAGREGPGQVFRCITAEQWSHLAAFSPPAISTSDLTGALLDCAVWGAPVGNGLPLPDPFPEFPARAATQSLVRLGALTPASKNHPFGQVTELGRRLAAMPLDPHLARGALLASQIVDVDTVAKVVFLLDATPDPSTALATQVSRVRSSEPGVTRIRKILDKHSRNVEGLPDLSAFTSSLSSAAEPPKPGSPEAIGLCVACCFPQLIARRVVDNAAEMTDRVLTVGGTGAALSRELLAATSGNAQQWFAVADIARAHTKDGTGARVRSAVQISEEVAIAAGGGVEKERTATFDPQTKKVRVREVRRLGAIELSSAPAQATKEESVRAVREALKEHGAELLPLSNNARNLLARMSFLHAHGVEGYPDVSSDLPEEVLEFAASDLAAWRAPDVAGLLRGLIPWDRPIDQWAPERLELPSGRNAAVTYPAEDPHAAPIIATKLQDAFGLHESPRIAGVPVQFHLLSPAGRPLAVTDDLRSFWQGPYQGVRKDMRGRYPKHKWPENPSELV